MVGGPISNQAGSAPVLVLFGAGGGDRDADLLPCQQAQKGLTGILAAELGSWEALGGGWAGSRLVSYDVFVDAGKA